MAVALRCLCDEGKKNFEVLAGKLDTLSPLAVLGRGYSITFLERTGRVLRKSQGVVVGDSLATRLGEGQCISTVLKVEEGT
jgi:exodeoxyribonuclease VII large subunit